MAKVFLTKRIEFSASHRYHNESWDAARNRAVFGLCNMAPGHGHNYLLEVTVAGDPPGDTGMVVNLYDLKMVLKEVLVEFDHKHLNHDTPYFKDRMPTTENIAGVLWHLLGSRPKIGELERIRLYEDEDLFAEVTRSSLDDLGRVVRAAVTRRFHFSAAHRVSAANAQIAKRNRRSGSCGSGMHGHNYRLEVTVGGRIKPETGMVVDLESLNRTVDELILQRFDGGNLNDDPDLAGGTTGDRVARLMWHLLVNALPVRLERIALAETQDTIYEYAAT
jgi:6-pyruvoyltetrahydropterin/6-carboxytetrahydropterin synthase